MANLMLLGVLGRCKMVGEPGPSLLVALDVLSAQPGAELGRLHFDPLDFDAVGGEARDYAGGVFLPLVERVLQASAVLSERSDCFVVLPCVPSHDDQVGLGLRHPRHRLSSESEA
jgi:hypothetical protein